VLSRLHIRDVPARSRVGERRLWELASSHLPPGRASDYNQAWMDLGATICVPRNPACLICPLMDLCEARALSVQDQRPVLPPRRPVPHLIVAAGILTRAGQTLITRRPPEGLLGGMWEFPNGRVDQDPAKELTKVLNAAYKLRVRKKDALGIIQHAYTHFKVTVHAFRCEFVSVPKNKNLKWVKITDLTDYPMGKVDRGIANLL